MIQQIFEQCGPLLFGVAAIIFAWRVKPIVVIGNSGWVTLFDKKLDERARKLEENNP